MNTIKKSFEDLLIGDIISYNDHLFKIIKHHENKSVILPFFYTKLRSDQYEGIEVDEDFNLLPQYNYQLFQTTQLPTKRMKPNTIQLTEVDVLNISNPNEITTMTRYIFTQTPIKSGSIVRIGWKLFKIFGDEFTEDFNTYFCFKGKQINSDLEFVMAGEIKVFHSKQEISPHKFIFKIYDVMEQPPSYFLNTHIRIKRKYAKDLLIGDIIADKNHLMKIIGHEESRWYENNKYVGIVTDIYLCNEVNLNLKPIDNIIKKITVTNNDRPPYETHYELVEYDVVVVMDNPNEIKNMDKRSGSDTFMYDKYEFARKQISTGDIVKLRSKLFKIINTEYADPKSINNFCYEKDIIQVIVDLKVISNGEVKVFDSKHEESIQWYDVMIQPSKKLIL